MPGGVSMATRRALVVASITFLARLALDRSTPTVEGGRHSRVE
jgi:hypothetical protein